LKTINATVIVANNGTSINIENSGIKGFELGVGAKTVDAGVGVAGTDVAGVWVAGIDAIGVWVAGVDAAGVAVFDVEVAVGKGVEVGLVDVEIRFW
jgi:hypothetical protein